MMEKEFVSFEVALRLKQLGFNEGCFAWFDSYNENELHTWRVPDGMVRNTHIPSGTAAPLIQQVIDWFEKEYSIYVTALPYRDADTELSWYYTLVEDNEELPDIMCNENDLGAHGDLYETKREALMEGILEALKIVEE